MIQDAQPKIDRNQLGLFLLVVIFISAIGGLFLLKKLSWTGLPSDLPDILTAGNSAKAGPGRVIKPLNLKVLENSGLGSLTEEELPTYKPKRGNSQPFTPVKEKASATSTPAD